MVLLNADAPLNMDPMMVTEEVSQFPMNWLNEVLDLNMEPMAVTLLRVPIPDGLVEGVCSVKHVTHVGHGACVPIAYVLVENRGAPLTFDTCWWRCLRPKDFMFSSKVARLKKRFAYSSPRKYPIADVPVGGCCVGFVAEPKVDRGLEVGVGEGSDGGLG